MSASPKILLRTLLLVALGFAAYWLLSLDPDAPSDIDWDANRQNLPDISALEQRIETNLFGDEAEGTEGMSADIDEVVNHSAMEIKLEGLTKNITTTRQPTDKELAAFYAEHKAQYRESSRFSFKQIVFSRAKHGGQARLKAMQALQALQALQGISETEPQGDQSTLAERYFSATSTRIDDEFGNNFAQKLFELVNEGDLPCWAGPIASGHGVHLVCIENASLGVIPKLEGVRSQVINDWRFSVVEEN